MCNNDNLTTGTHSRQCTGLEVVKRFEPICFLRKWRFAKIFHSSSQFFLLVFSVTKSWVSCGWNNQGRQLCEIKMFNQLDCFPLQDKPVFFTSSTPSSQHQCVCLSLTSLLCLSLYPPPPICLCLLPQLSRSLYRTDITALADWG